MQNYEFTYTVIPTGIQISFTIPDPAEDAYAAEVARAVFNALGRVTNITNVTAAKVNDVRTVTRGAIP